jgi:uncharacterized protein YaiI (UPF0178 family)
MRDIVFKASMRLSVPVIVVGNSYMHAPAGGLIKMVVVPGGFDAADQYIIEHVAPGHLVITSDIPLASAIVAKGAFGLSSRGEEFNKENVQERLAIRNLSAEIRSTGALPGGPSALGARDISKFASAFDRLITRLCKSS